MVRFAIGRVDTMKLKVENTTIGTRSSNNWGEPSLEQLPEVSMRARSRESIRAGWGKFEGLACLTTLEQGYKYRLDTETKGSTRFRNLRALGCSVSNGNYSYG